MANSFLLAKCERPRNEPSLTLRGILESLARPSQWEKCQTCAVRLRSMLSRRSPRLVASAAGQYTCRCTSHCTRGLAGAGIVCLPTPEWPPFRRTYRGTRENLNRTPGGVTRATLPNLVILLVLIFWQNRAKAIEP